MSSRISNDICGVYDICGVSDIRGVSDIQGNADRSPCCSPLLSLHSFSIRGQEGAWCWRLRHRTVSHLPLSPSHSLTPNSPPALLQGYVMHPSAPRSYIPNSFPAKEATWERKRRRPAQLPPCKHSLRMGGIFSFLYWQPFMAP